MKKRIKLKKEPTSLSLMLPSTRNKFKKLLFQNELYFKQQDGTICSAVIEWETLINEQNDKVIKVICNYTNITKIDEKLKNLESTLISLFNAPMLSKAINFNKTEYVFLLKSTEQETVILNDELAEEKTNLVTLDKYHIWNVDKPDTTHILIAGMSGSGKSRTAYNILKQIRNTTSDHYIFIIDPKADELFKVASQNFGLSNIATPVIKNENLSPNQMEQVILDFYKMMYSRYEKAKGNPKIKEKFEHSYLIIDEVAVMKNLYNIKNKNEKERFEQLNKALTAIALLGRAAKCHLILILQQPSAENLSTQLRDQLGIRILMGNPTNAQTVKMTFGDNEKEIFEKEVGQGLILMNSKLEDFNSPKIYFPEELEN